MAVARREFSWWEEIGPSLLGRGVAVDGFNFSVSLRDVDKPH